MNDKTCYACGQIGKSRTIGVEIESLKSVHKVYPTCLSDKHPNHPDKVEERGYAIEIIDTSVILDYLREYMPDYFQAIQRLYGKTLSFNADFQHTRHMLKVQQRYGIRSIRGVLAKIIEEHAELTHNVYDDMNMPNYDPFNIPKSYNNFEKVEKSKEDEEITTFGEDEIVI